MSSRRAPRSSLRAYEVALFRFRVLLAEQRKLGAAIDRQMRLLKYLRDHYKGA